VEEHEEMEGEEETGEEAECVMFLSRKSKLSMDKFLCLNILIPDWRTNKWCICLAILGDESAILPLQST
jgi:hypothetical protein